MPYTWHRESTLNLTQETLTRNRVTSKAERTHALGRARVELCWDLQLTSLMPSPETHTSQSQPPVQTPAYTLHLLTRV